MEKKDASLQKKLQRMAEIALEREREQSFRPSKNPNSERILCASDKFAGKDFYARQEEALVKQFTRCVVVCVCVYACMYV